MSRKKSNTQKSREYRREHPTYNAEYIRDWRKRHPIRNAEIQIDYWQRRLARLKAMGVEDDC